jgi:hypothetical protein
MSSRLSTVQRKGLTAVVSLTVTSAVVTRLQIDVATLHISYRRGHCAVVTAER